jgi:hypothetical protein
MPDTHTPTLWDDNVDVPDSPLLRGFRPPFSVPPAPVVEPNHLLAVCQNDMRQAVSNPDPVLPDLVKEILAAARLAIAEGDFKAARALYRDVLDCRGGTPAATQASVHQHVHLHGDARVPTAADLSLLSDTQLRELAARTASPAPCLSAP